MLSFLTMSTNSNTRASISAGTAAALAVGASVSTAAAAYFYHQRQTRRLEAKLTEQRMAERRGRIRAEVQLRTLTKEVAGGGITGSSDISSSSAINNSSSSPAGPDNLLKCIGKVVSPYTKRAGTPRQGQLAPSARGYIQLSIPTQMVEGMELYSHCWVHFAFHANTDMGSSKKTKIRPPRAPSGCKVGMLATRSPHRPNNLGLVGSAIASIAGCAQQLEQGQRSNLALFERNHFGDTDGFFDTSGDIAIFQCANCLRCFDDPGRSKCSAATLVPLTGRISIFGTICPAPSSTRRRTDSTAPPADCCEVIIDH